MKPLLSLIVVIVAFTALMTTVSSAPLDFSSAVRGDDCTYIFVGGESYDFSDVGTIAGMWGTIRPAYLNLCANIKDKCTEGKNSICSPPTDPGSGDVSFASRSPGYTPPVSTYNPTTGINSIKESSGAADCFTQDYGPRKTEIQITCTTKTDTSFVIQQTSPCQFQIKLNVNCQAPGGGLSGGGIFLIIFFSLFAAYFIIGFLVCKFVMKKQTFSESIPQYQFWSSLPGFFVAGIKVFIGFVKSKISGGKSSGSSGSSSGSSTYGTVDDI
jgi:hypothetical protein